MSYKRIDIAAALRTGNSLTADMAGIGINFATEATPDPNIEDTLLGASLEGMEGDDLRVLALMATWLDVHHPRVNADRLMRAARSLESLRARAFWAATGTWLHGDSRFRRFVDLHTGSRIDLLRTGTDFHIGRRGEDERFAGSALRLPAGVLRDRRHDVLPAEKLAGRHSTYRYRVQMGSNYRADMWAALERDPTLSPTALARITYGSFATAWHVRHDHELLQSVALMDRP